jgi:hypothetical protein
MSPALLSKRLKDLEAAGIVARSKVVGEPQLFEYQLTNAGRELGPVIDGVGAWGHRWIKTEASLKNLDVNLLMWGIRDNINPDPMPMRRTTIQIIFTDLPKARRNWWLVAQPGEGVDLCSIHPGFDVDLYLSTDLRTLTEVWMGYTPLKRAKQEGRLTITGNRQLEADMKSWFGLNRFAAEKSVA